MINGRRGRDGFALAAAMFLLLVVSGVLLDSALKARVEREQALRSLDAVRARAAARAGVVGALVRLDQLQAGATGLEIGAGDEWNHLDDSRLLHEIEAGEIDGASYRVSVQDLGEKLPMNQANPEELSRLFSALGLDATSADALVRAIVARRSMPIAGVADSTVGRFAAPDELRGVRGIHPEDIDRIRDYLTGFNGGHVNVNTAPEPVLRALPGLDDDAVRWILRQRAYRTIHSLGEIEAGLSTGSHKHLMESYFALARRAAFSPEAVEITALGEAGQPATRIRVRAIASRTPSGFVVVQEADQ